MHMKTIASLAVVLFIFGAGGTASADPKGLWVAEDHAQVRIADCSRRSQALCATVAAARSSVDPETGRPWTDKHNPDQNARNRPLVGVYVLYNMLPDGAGKWAGTLYNTDDGHTYPGHLLETGPRSIRIEGCAIGICGGRNLTRVR
jgi:uncharacterized protein (DUF2147 family)